MDGDSFLCFSSFAITEYFLTSFPLPNDFSHLKLLTADIIHYGHNYLLRNQACVKPKIFLFYSLLFLFQGWARNLYFCNSWSSMLIQDYSQVMFQDFSELVARIRKEYLAAGIWVWIRDFSSGLGICSDNSWGWDIGSAAQYSEPSFSVVSWCVVLWLTQSETIDQRGKVWQESHLLQHGI